MEFSLFLEKLNIWFDDLLKKGKEAEEPILICEISYDDVFWYVSNPPSVRLFVGKKGIFVKIGSKEEALSSPLDLLKYFDTRTLEKMMERTFSD